MRSFLSERRTWDEAEVILEESHDRDEKTGKPKNLFMKGIFIEGDVRNHNNRIYPVNEIIRAVNQLRDCISRGETIYGEADHPEDLNINLDRVSHIVEDIRMEGSRGVGKLRIIPTPMGNLVRTIIESGGKLGVSSRGSGNVDINGKVNDFEILTIDIVARPSAPNAFPKPIYERLMNYSYGNRIYRLSSAATYDAKSKTLNKELRQQVRNFLDELLKE